MGHSIHLPLWLRKNVETQTYCIGFLTFFDLGAHFDARSSEESFPQLLEFHVFFCAKRLMFQ
jgi:hypothetical protein